MDFDPSNNDFGNDQGPAPLGFMMGLMLLNQMQQNRQARGDNDDWKIYLAITAMVLVILVGPVLFFWLLSMIN